MVLTSSTLPPAEVARLMVESGIAKFKTRADHVFLKAVSSHARPRYPLSSFLDSLWVVSSCRLEDCWQKSSLVALLP